MHFMSFIVQSPGHYFLHGGLQGFVGERKQQKMNKEMLNWLMGGGEGHHANKVIVFRVLLMHYVTYVTQQKYKK